VQHRQEGGAETKSEILVLGHTFVKNTFLFSWIKLISMFDMHHS